MNFQKISLQKSKERKKSIRVIICLLFMFLSCLFIKPQIPTAKEMFSQEYIIKSAFIYNFAKFIEWPPSVSDSPSFTICILGEDPFGEVIDTINGKTIRLSKVRIRYIISIEELQKISDCKILYISQSEKKNIPRILYKINRQPIVTITEHANTAQSGVIINFIVKDDKVRFEINTGAALKAGIKISSELLKLAIKVIE